MSNFILKEVITFIGTDKCRDETLYKECVMSVSECEYSARNYGEYKRISLKAILRKTYIRSVCLSHKLH